MTINLTHDAVEAGAEVLATVQLRVKVTDAAALEDHALVAKLYAALEPARKLFEQVGVIGGFSLSIQPYEEEDEDVDQAR